MVGVDELPKSVLRSLFRDHGIRIVGSAAQGGLGFESNELLTKRAFEDIKRHRPDVVVVGTKNAREAATLARLSRMRVVVIVARGKDVWCCHLRSNSEVIEDVSVSELLDRIYGGAAKRH